jgi:pyruvate dehydrogenase E2 component (dihydrolipoamide acetyltransferase)
MATPVTMPRQGQSVETCIITKWFKNKGEHVEKGEILFSYETDKAAFDMESPAEGILLEILCPEGAEVPVLENVAVIGASGEDITTLIKPKETLPEINETGTGIHIDSSKTEAVQPGKATGVTPGKLRISPKARRIARDAGIDTGIIEGTGPSGRIISRDIQQYLEAVPGVKKAAEMPDKESVDRPLSNIRKIIANAMLSSLQNSAQLTHHMTADVRKILEVRKIIKDSITTGTIKQDITLNDMTCWCVIRALEKHPEVNSHFLGDAIRTFSRVHLAIAVDTPRGLMVPSVKNADGMTLEELSYNLKTIAESCRKGNIDPELLQSQSASFTVSNLGNYGVEMFTPVLNLPQVAILGVCTIVNRPADLGNNTFGFIPVIGLSLTYDHRAIDGGPATLFLKEIRDQIESFKYPVP